MLILLINLSVAYVISTLRPEEVDNETLEQTRKRSKWDNDDFICSNLITIIGVLPQSLQITLIDSFGFYTLPIY